MFNLDPLHTSIDFDAAAMVPEPIPFQDFAVAPMAAHNPTAHALSWDELRDWLDSLDATPSDPLHSIFDTTGSPCTDNSDAFSSCGSLTDSSTSSPSPVHSPSSYASTICTASKCFRSARTNGLCKDHGGRWECHVDGCMKEAMFSDYCVDHGGGKCCKIYGCSNAAQSQGRCKAHGGGARCKYEGCEKSSQGGGFCRAHGGGKRCTHEGCDKGVQRGNKCTRHGGCRSCTVAGCTRTDRGGGLCEFHRKDRMCTVEGCKRLSHALGMCKPHMRQHRNQTLAPQEVGALW